MPRRGGDSDAAGGCGEDLFYAEVGGGGSGADGLLSGIARLKTLAVRMLQHNANGLAVARHLDAHPKVRKVFIPDWLRIRSMSCRRQQKGPGR